MILGETPDGMLGVLDHLIPDITDCAKKEQQPSGRLGKHRKTKFDLHGGTTQEAQAVQAEITNTVNHPCKCMILYIYIYKLDFQYLYFGYKIFGLQVLEKVQTQINAIKRPNQDLNPCDSVE